MFLFHESLLVSHKPFRRLALAGEDAKTLRCRNVILMNRQLKRFLMHPFHYDFLNNLRYFCIVGII